MTVLTTDLSMLILARLSAPTLTPTHVTSTNLTRLLSSSPVSTRANPYNRSSSWQTHARAQLHPTTFRVSSRAHWHVSRGSTWPLACFFVAVPVLIPTVVTSIPTILPAGLPIHLTPLFEPQIRLLLTIVRVYKLHIYWHCIFDVLTFTR